MRTLGKPTGLRNKCFGMQANKLGYTLIEIVVATTVLAMVMILSIQSATMMIKVERKSQDYVFAAHQAQGIIEKIEEAPCEDINYGAVLPPSRLQLPASAEQQVPLQGLSEGYYTVEIQPKYDTVADADYKLIKVTVAWFMPGTERKLHQVELLSRVYPIFTY